MWPLRRFRTRRYQSKLKNVTNRPQRICLLCILGVFTLFWHAQMLAQAPEIYELESAQEEGVQEEATQEAVPARIVSKSIIQWDPSWDKRNESVTVVTAFFDLGRFKKGEGNLYFEPNYYFNWAKSYSALHNPLVVYTDSPAFAKIISTPRKHSAFKTKIVIVNRESMWAFQLRGRIENIYSDPKYPKWSPNTVMPDYTCAQHAKYNVMNDAISNNFFNTNYFSWLDVGYFRGMTDSADSIEDFYLALPPRFHNEAIAVNKVNETSMLLEPRTIFHHNYVWVGGGMFLGHKDVMRRYTSSYRRAVEYYLSQGLSNTDQQVIYSMYTQKEKDILKPEAELQVYVPPADSYKGDIWFYLGYLSYRTVR